ncbi:hypothetical protein J7J26_03840 [Candidatus Micrarchaeota archaeon]|nr:hypothetical protein [Candidatus Micrarchaeota archaeon]
MKEGGNLGLLNLLVRSSKKNTKEISVLNRNKRGMPFKFSHEFILSIYLLYVFLDKSLSRVLDFLGDLVPNLPHRTTIIKRLDKVRPLFKGYVGRE